MRRLGPVAVMRVWAVTEATYLPTHFKTGSEPTLMCTRKKCEGGEHEPKVKQIS